MRKNFRTFNLAVEFYQLTASLRLPSSAKDHLRRAARSVALNLAEGRGRTTTKDQLRFFHIAQGSLRECQAVMITENLDSTPQWNTLDQLGAALYRLIKNAR